MPRYGQPLSETYSMSDILPYSNPKCESHISRLFIGKLKHIWSFKDPHPPAVARDVMGHIKTSLFAMKSGRRAIYISFVKYAPRHE